MGERFTAGRVPDSGIGKLFETQNRWQAWLDVEAALAETEAELELIPSDAAEAICASCHMERLNPDRIREGIARMSHPLMPLIVELSRVVGDPHDGWIHWGVTTQNVTQTGDVLIVRRAHRILLGLLGEIMSALAHLADRSADMVMAGRTHGQHAVPITFGFKVAGWIDELSRHVERLREIEPRLFVAIVGGAAGNFAALGKIGPDVQRGVSDRLGLEPMPVASRSTVDQFAELVCVLGLLGATCGKIAREVYNLMKTEVGEMEEPVPAGTVGSSTMPQKRNPQLCQDILGISAELRAFVPLALETVLSEHEADHTPTILFDTIGRSCTIAGEALERIKLIVSDLRVFPERMKANLDLSHGMISAEALMIELGRTLGRQHAHEAVYEAAQTAATDQTSFLEVLAADPRITGQMNAAEIETMLDPLSHTGLSSAIAHTQAEAARSLAAEVRAHLEATA